MYGGRDRLIKKYEDCQHEHRDKPSGHSNRSDRKRMYIQPDECVDCGACEPVCPVEAIYYEDDVPSQWSAYKEVNAEFFDELGSPGGASKVGPVAKDHPKLLQIQKKPSGE
ncbi:MAG: ferredoxin family protein [Actinobacteria bacterium]|nr:ferredoxin family protein [Actinomycetota bacterium]